MHNNLLNTLFGAEARPDLKQKQQDNVDLPVAEASISPSVAEPPYGKFDADIQALQKKFGKLESGLGIMISLKELLAICPRKRKRTDAYHGLVNYLEKSGVSLIIISSKSK